MLVLIVWATSPRGFLADIVGISSFGLASSLAFVILLRVPMRVMAESSEVFPGTPEQAFQFATDIKLGLQVTGEPRKLVSQT
ncbi:MAG TPA: hypothetical protein VLS53_03290, partial [Candidatus Dormibacteraeota bacterium]|nr:hypothetical protein [Candidatus Dormibacteraeota bacterium]